MAAIRELHCRPVLCTNFPSLFTGLRCNSNRTDGKLHHLLTSTWQHVHPLVLAHADVAHSGAVFIAGMLEPFET